MNLQVDTIEKSLLIIEDNPEDFVTTERAFRKVNFTNKIFHCIDGDTALDFLFHRGEYHDIEKSPRPSMIVLDLNMPGTDGRKVLETIKNDTSLKSIPVIILTTSADENDIEGCYQSGANCYLQKPVDYKSFVSAINSLKEYWFEFAILPK